jgi:membrane associated rhomboid family serine protease
MFLIVPYHVDVPMQRPPWANWVLIALTMVCYPFCLWDGELTSLGQSLVLGGDGLLGWVGYVLVHDGIFHLLGNMLFLWVFGNAVCAKVGNLAYPFIYFGLGLTAGLVSYMIDSRPTIGASGAVNGIVGMFVVWYLFNEISCWYCYWFFNLANVGSFSIGSIWMVLFWLVFDIWGALRGGGNIAYIAHVAGFGTGFIVAVMLLTLRLVEMEQGERSLLQLFSNEDESRPEPKNRFAKKPGQRARKR